MRILLYFYFSLGCFANYFDFSITEDSVKKVRESSSFWKVSFGEKKRYFVRGYKKGDKVRLDLYFDSEDNFLYSIIIKNKLWYVRDSHGRKSVYNAYCVPLKLPIFYSYILRSRPQFLAGVHLRDLGKAYWREKEIVFVKNIDDKMKRDLAGVLHTKKLKQYLKQGLIHKVDRKTYLIKYIGLYNQEINFEEFSWRKLDDSYFLTDGIWEKHLNYVAKEWVLASYQAYPKALSDCRLVNVRTSKVRRLPLRGLVASCATFAKDKSIVYAAEASLLYNFHNLVKIDLVNNQVRRIKLPQKVQIKEMKVSPTGRFLAMIYQPYTLRGFKNIHIMVMSLTSFKPVYISNPIDCVYLDWVNARELIFQQNIIQGEFFLPLIRQLDLRYNKMSDIAVGTNPVWHKGVLYFINLARKNWVKLDKKLGKLISFGLAKKVHSQTVDSKRWLMIDYSKKIPMPLIYNLETDKSIKLNLSGFWR